MNKGGQRALFLDRDGVINRDRGYVCRIEDFEFVDGIFELCAAAQARGMALVVVTNQAAIGRGFCTEADFQVLTKWMLGRFAARGIRFTAVEFCPDHPTRGIGPYRRDTVRRKPGPGMILDACAAYNLIPSVSVMIGDRVIDMQAAHAAGVTARILLPADAEEMAAAPPEGTIVIREGGLKAAKAMLEQLP